MAMFTKTIREIIENDVQLFDFAYPIFDASYKAVLEEKIINHFYFREIGVETVGRFKWNLKTRMNEIMPYFNKMYMVQGLEQRIMDNYDVTESYNRTVTDNGTIAVTNNETTNTTGHEEGSDTAKKLFSDTPQGRTDLASSEFVTTINDDTVTDLSDSTGTNVSFGNTNQTDHKTNTENWVRTMTGNIGVQTDADAVNKYMSAIINVDLEVIKALNDLFMQVY